MRGKPLFLLIGFFAYSLLYLPAASSAANPTTSAPLGVRAEVVEARLKEVDASTEYDEATRNKLLDLYRKTLTQLESKGSNQAQEKKFAAARESARPEATRLLEKLEQRKNTEKPVNLEVGEKTPLAEVEQQLLKQKADYSAVDAKLSGLNEQIDFETARPDQTRRRLNEARQQLEALGADAKLTPPADQSPLLGEARTWYRQAQSQALNAEIHMLDQELLSQPQRLELLQAQRDITAHNLKRIREHVTLLETLLSSQRRSEVEETLAQAESTGDEYKDTHPVVQALAKRNAAASEELASLSEKLETTVSGDRNADSEAKRIEEEFRRAQQKLEVAGLSQTLGQVLVEQRRQLPNARRIQARKNEREQEIATTALNQLQFNEEIKNLSDTNAFVDALLAGKMPEEALELRGDLLTLAESRLALLKKSRELNSAYLRALGELDYAETRLITAVEKYDTFLAERLLWIRSGAVPTIDMLLNLPAQLLQFLSPVTWLGVAVVLAGQLFASPLPVLGLLLIIGLLIKQPAMKEALVQSGRKTLKPRSDQFSYTLQALALSVLLALPWPLLFLLIGWMLSTAPDTETFSRALSDGLFVLAPVFLYLNAFHYFCRDDGLGETHFRWPEKSTRALSRQITLLMLVFIPAAVVAIISSQQTDSAEDALARIAYIIMMTSLSYFFYRLFATDKAVLTVHFKRFPEGILARLRYLWLTLALIIPLLLIILVISGYSYTASILTKSVIDTLWLVLGFLIVHQLAVRWLKMTQRKLDFEAAMERRRAALAAAAEEAAAAKEAATSAETSESGDTSEQVDIEEPEIDLKALNEESKKLLNGTVVIGAVIGLWFIWSEVLPAFSLLEKYTLWHYTGKVDGDETQIPVTLASILLAVVIIAVTVVATKRFPSLLEIVLLKRVSFTAGGRYAATTLSRYAIAAVGGLLALSTIGFSWSQVQWLAAALSVGIGFGLQEIVANFISGIIILFERPIRVGDVVTIGDIDGTVTRIQIRATTIRTWDRQELLVPNKEFITGRLLNWSLSDQTTRIKVPVGVAYGSDVPKAMKLMREAALEHPLVLEDPQPGIIFDAFADNSLNLELRCFVASQDDRMPVRTKLHEIINDKFNEAGLVIAFPQRDVHLDTSKPLDIRIQPSENT